MGPVITPAAKTRIEDYTGQGVAEGAQLVRDGRGLTVKGAADGCFIGPTVFDRVTPAMSIYTEINVIQEGSVA